MRKVPAHKKASWTNEALRLLYQLQDSLESRKPLDWLISLAKPQRAIKKVASNIKEGDPIPLGQERFWIHRARFKAWGKPPIYMELLPGDMAACIQKSRRWNHCCNFFRSGQRFP